MFGRVQKRGREKQADLSRRLCFGSLREPRGNLRSNGNAFVYQGGNPMVSIDDFEMPVADESNDRLGDSAIRADEVCTCPKPLLGAAHICGACLRTAVAVLNNCGDSRSRELANWCRDEINFHPLPFAIRPNTQRNSPQNVIPLGALYFVCWIGKGPTIFLNNWGKPHLKNFVRHLSKELTRFRHYFTQLKPLAFLAAQSIPPSSKRGPKCPPP